MPVFSNKLRSRRDLMRPGEGAFAFFNSCGRQAFGTFRSLVNEWTAEMPIREQHEIKRRMMKGSDQQFYAALTELIVHAMLKRQGHRVTIHPKLEGSAKTPDFLAASTDDKPLAYVEVTTFGPTPEEVAAAKRAAALEQAVTNAKLPPGYLLA